MNCCFVIYLIWEFILNFFILWRHRFNSCFLIFNKSNSYLLSHLSILCLLYSSCTRIRMLIYIFESFSIRSIIWVIFFYRKEIMEPCRRSKWGIPCWKWPAIRPAGGWRPDKLNWRPTTAAWTITTIATTISTTNSTPTTISTTSITNSRAYDN